MRRTDEASAARIKTMLTVSGVMLVILTFVPKIVFPLLYVLQDKTWLIILINPMPVFLARSAAHDPLWLYLLAGSLRLSLSLPVHYILGKYGVQALHRPAPRWVRAIRRWLERPTWLRVRSWLHWLATPLHWSRHHFTRRIKDVLVRNFPRYGYVLVALRPNTWTLLLAGGFKLKPRYVAVAGAIGILLWLATIGFLQDYLPQWAFLAFSIF